MPAVKHGDGSVILWGCFAFSRTVEGKMDLLEYQEIPGENIMPSVSKLKLGGHWNFQQDNDPQAYLKFHKGFVTE